MAFDERGVSETRVETRQEATGSAPAEPRDTLDALDSRPLRPRPRPCPRDRGLSTPGHRSPSLDPSRPIHRPIHGVILAGQSSLPERRSYPLTAVSAGARGASEEGGGSSCLAARCRSRRRSIAPSLSTSTLSIPCPFAILDLSSLALICVCACICLSLE